MPQAIDLLAAFDPLGGKPGTGPAAPARRYALLDVFTDRPLEGNQLAVLTDARGLSGEEMQRIARELRLPETVFALAPIDAGEIGIRIFTPETELPFAGHPVLGTGMLLASALGCDQVTLETGMGPVEVRVRWEDGRVVPAGCASRFPRGGAGERWGAGSRRVSPASPPGAGRAG